MTSTPIILETYTANYLDNDTPSDIIGLGTGADGKFHLYLKTGENNWVAVDKSLLDFDGDGKADPLVMPTAATGYLDIQPKALPPLRTDLPADVACTYEYDTRYSFGAPRGFRDWSETSPTYKGESYEILSAAPGRPAVYATLQTAECLYTQHYDINGDGHSDTIYRKTEGDENKPKTITAVTYRIASTPQQ